MSGEPLTAAQVGRRLHALLYSPPAFALLEPYGCGWLDGGCRILADALGAWLGVEDRAALVDASGRAQHAFIMCSGWCLDGDGATRPDMFTRRWREVEGVDGRIVADGAAAIRRSNEFSPSSMPADAATSASLAKMIETSIPATQAGAALRRA